MKYYLLFLGWSCWSFCLFAQIPAELPNVSAFETCFPDTTGYTRVTVGPVNRDFSDLQMAIDAANPGTVLVLDAGIVFQGSFKLPKKVGDGWIVLISAQMQHLPEQGFRVAPEALTGSPDYPAQQSAMPKIMTNNPSGLPCFTTQASAHHYRLVGLEILADTNLLNSYGLVHFGDGGAAQNTMDEVPHHMIVDRCYIHGHDKATIMKSGVLLNCASGAVLDSYIADFHSIGADTYAIGGTNGPGPFIIRNNYLEAAGENILFGGAAPNIPGLVPSDIEVRNNHFFKPFSWRLGHPTYAGKHWTIKNLFELKTGKRVLLDGNVLENCWADLPIGQSGYAILLTVRAEAGNAPQADVSDITITNNIVRHAGAGISLSGHDSPTPSLQSKRIHIGNNLFDDISGADYGDGNVAGPNDGTFLKIGDPSDVLIEHNTVFQSGAITWAYDTTLNIAFRNNIFNCFLSDGGYQGIYGPGFGQGGNGPMGRYFPGITDQNQGFHKNVLIGGADFRYSNYNTLSTNYFPANQSAVQFVDYGNGGIDYQGFALSGSSLYYKAATDGEDIGVDIEGLGEALDRIWSCEPLLSSKSALANDWTITTYPNPGIGGQTVLVSNRYLNEAEVVIWDFWGREIWRKKAVWGKEVALEIYCNGFYQVIQGSQVLGGGVLLVRR